MFNSKSKFGRFVISAVLGAALLLQSGLTFAAYQLCSFGIITNLSVYFSSDSVLRMQVIVNREGFPTSPTYVTYAEFKSDNGLLEQLHFEGARAALTSAMVSGHPVQIRSRTNNCDDSKISNYEYIICANRTCN